MESWFLAWRVCARDFGAHKKILLILKERKIFFLKILKLYFDSKFANDLYNSKFIHFSLNYLHEVPLF